MISLRLFRMLSLLIVFAFVAAACSIGSETIEPIPDVMESVDVADVSEPDTSPVDTGEFDVSDTTVIDADDVEPEVIEDYTAYEICVLGAHTHLSTNCAIEEVLDFEGLPLETRSKRRFRILNAGTLPLTWTRSDFSVGSPDDIQFLFEATHIDDTAFDPNDVLVPVQAPFVIEPGVRVAFDVGLIAGLTEGELIEATMEIIFEDDAGEELSATLPILAIFEACSEGRASCDGEAATGCEVDTRTNMNHCGACGEVCTLPNAICTDAVCIVNPCDVGYGDCTDAPGCETHLNTDLDHCGACGQVCELPNATPQCLDGECAIDQCDAGFASCSASAPGCETDLKTNVEHCGACENACSLPNATPTCSAGDCLIEACAAEHFQNCDGDHATGCEVDTRTAMDHCGACGEVCTVPNGSGLCTNGVCVVDQCNAGYGDCTDAPGCETHINTDPNNCGGCDQVCGANSPCSAGICQAARPAYYVSPTGNDANSGTSAQSPWQTITRANTAMLQAGDRLLFEGGKTFSGTLTFDANDQGTPDNPIVVGTYGAGRATLNAGNDRGIFIYNTAGIEISGLNVVGSGRTSNTADGVFAYVDLGGDVKLEHLVFDDLEVRGFGQSGIIVGANNGNSGFKHVRITRSRSHDNAVAGIQVYGPWSSNPTGYAMEDVYIGHCIVHGNTGIAGLTYHTGNGIVIGGVDGGVIERSVAYNNGSLNDANSEGPVGIWAWDSNNITIQYNEAYGNRTNSIADGGGFDLDGGVTNSVMQYNYSHDNDGAGFLLAQYSGAARPFSNNIVRYNISQNDGRKNGYAGINLWTASSENANNPIRDISIYGNTVFVSPSANGSPSALQFFQGTRTVNVRIHNNLFVTTGGVTLVNIPTGQEGLVVRNNGYWSSGNTFRITHHGTNYSSLSAWRQASGHEMNGGTPVGLQADPLLQSPGGGGTLGDADLLPTVQAYQLQSNSPAIDAGIDLGWPAGMTDYFGNAVPLGNAPDLGVHEAR